MPEGGASVCEGCVALGGDGGGAADGGAGAPLDGASCRGGAAGAVGSLVMKRSCGWGEGLRQVDAGWIRVEVEARRRVGRLVAIGGFGGCVAGFFHVGHDLGESFVGAGEDGGERAEFGAGLEAAPLQVVEFAISCGDFDVAEAELAPDSGGGVGEDGVEESGDDADGFGGSVEDVRKSATVIVARVCFASFQGAIGDDTSVND